MRRRERLASRAEGSKHRLQVGRNAAAPCHACHRIANSRWWGSANMAFLPPPPPTFLLPPSSFLRRRGRAHAAYIGTIGCCKTCRNCLFYAAVLENYALNEGFASTQAFFLHRNECRGVLTMFFSQNRFPPGMPMSAGATRVKTGMPPAFSLPQLPWRKQRFYAACLRAMPAAEQHDDPRRGRLPPPAAFMLRPRVMFWLATRECRPPAFFSEYLDAMKLF